MSYVGEIIAIVVAIIALLGIYKLFLYLAYATEQCPDCGARAKDVEDTTIDPPDASGNNIERTVTCHNGHIHTRRMKFDPYQISDTS